MTTTYREVPEIADLPAQIEVDLGDEKAVTGAVESGRAGAVGRGDVARAEELAELLVGGFAVARGELAWVDLGADAVDRTGVVAVGDGGTACLHAPQRLERL